MSASSQQPAASSRQPAERSDASVLSADSAHHAIDDLHEFLAANTQLAADSQDMLMREGVTRHLTFGGVPFSRYLRPHLITAGQYGVIRDVVQALGSAMIKLRRAILNDESLLTQLDLTDEERRLALIDPGFEEPSPSARLDSFWSERDWRFVEMNAESPAAIAYEDILGELFLELPAMRAWQSQRGYKLTPLFARERFMQAIREVWAEFRANRGAGYSETPNIAIVDWADVPTSSEFVLFERYFSERGFPVKIVTPEELEFRNGHLYSGDYRIDLYYKRVLTSELLSRPDVAKATLDAYEAGTICVINSFRAKLLHKKLSFALLHDDANAHLYSAREREIIKRHIPWTRKVSEGVTTFNGQQIDLVPFIIENRERLVLKPNDEYGGKGVTIGWTTDDAEWQAALKEALDGSYVVQGAVQLDQEPYPYYDAADGLCFRDVTADLDPFLFGTDTAGILTRLSAAALLNVTAGTGSVVPTMIVGKT
jgi:hypothetical protein